MSSIVDFWYVEIFVITVYLLIYLLCLLGILLLGIEYGYECFNEWTSFIYGTKRSYMVQSLSFFRDIEVSCKWKFMVEELTS